MEMEKIEFGYSLKNIGLPSQREYLSQLTHSCEKFVRNLRWRANFFLKPSSKPEKETYGFRSIKAAPKIKELKKLEEYLQCDTGYWFKNIPEKDKCKFLVNDVVEHYPSITE